jgi:hypothetical protein
MDIIIIIIIITIITIIIIPGPPSQPLSSSSSPPYHLYVIALSAAHLSPEYASSHWAPLSRSLGQLMSSSLPGITWTMIRIIKECGRARRGGGLRHKPFEGGGERESHPRSAARDPRPRPATRARRTCMSGTGARSFGLRAISRHRVPTPRARSDCARFRAISFRLRASRPGTRTPQRPRFARPAQARNDPSRPVPARPVLSARFERPPPAPIIGGGARGRSWHAASRSTRALRPSYKPAVSRGFKHCWRGARRRTSCRSALSGLSRNSYSSASKPRIKSQSLSLLPLPSQAEGVRLTQRRPFASCSACQENHESHDYLWQALQDI